MGHGLQKFGIKGKMAIRAWRNYNGFTTKYNNLRCNRKR